MVEPGPDRAAYEARYQAILRDLALRVGEATALIAVRNWRPIQDGLRRLDGDPAAATPRWLAHFRQQSLVRLGYTAEVLGEVANLDPGADGAAGHLRAAAQEVRALVEHATGGADAPPAG